MHAEDLPTLADPLEFAQDTGRTHSSLTPVVSSCHAHLFAREDNRVEANMHQLLMDILQTLCLDALRH